MKNSEIIKIYRGLSHLIEPADAEGKPIKPYSFSGPVSDAIVKNWKRAKAAVEHFDTTKQFIAKGLMKDGETSFGSDDERFGKFQTEVVKLLDAEADFSPIKIVIDDLQLGSNRIQPSVRLALDDILIDEDPIPTDAGAPSGV